VDVRFISGRFGAITKTMNKHADLVSEFTIYVKHNKLNTFKTNFTDGSNHPITGKQVLQYSSHGVREMRYAGGRQMTYIAILALELTNKALICSDSVSVLSLKVYDQ